MAQSLTSRRLNGMLYKSLIGPGVLALSNFGIILLVIKKKSMVIDDWRWKESQEA